eukprot:386384-Hanusia_phi.AAC.1
MPLAHAPCSAAASSNHPVDQGCRGDEQIESDRRRGGMEECPLGRDMEEEQMEEQQQQQDKEEVKEKNDSGMGMEGGHDLQFS